ncbi:hypothetical protein [Rhizobium terrae]|uniref:hypothetical protein n=1 Tax=Rhizobium terrae TaxID=2171756 RepID=UPI000E3D21DC|nr:hypothetical protein [Rhizobium terrae]
MIDTRELLDTNPRAASAADVWADNSPSLLSSHTAKMDFLYEQLARRGTAPEGMSWNLLLLEWKYDLAVLFGNLRDWMSYIDRRFDKPSE